MRAICLHQKLVTLVKQPGKVHQAQRNRALHRSIAPHQPAAYEGSTPLTMLGEGQLCRVHYVQRRVVHDGKVQHQLPQLVNDWLAKGWALQIYEH